MKVINVSDETGARVTDEVAVWRLGKSDHLAGPDRDGNLLVFTASPDTGRWVVENVTEQTGHAVSGPVVPWVTPDGSYSVEHLAARDAEGTLLVFVRSTRDSRWNVIDVTARTGRRAVGSLVNWQSQDGPYLVEHIGARDGDGHVLVFWWSPRADWQVVDVTAKTGRSIADGLTAWTTKPTGEHLAGTGDDGSVVVFSWFPGSDWQARAAASGFAGGVTAWTTGTVEHLAGARTNGRVSLLWRSGTAAPWQTVDVTAITQELVQGRPSVYQVRDGVENVEVLVSRTPSGHLLLHWWKPSRDWQAMDLTEISDVAVQKPPTGWAVAENGETTERIAAVAGDGTLRLFTEFVPARRMTDAVGRPIYSIERMRNTTRRMLVILWDPHYPGVTRPTREQVADVVFGPGHSVRSYFLENSGGTFTVASEGVYGWYEADHPLEWYDGATPRDKCGAAIKAAARDIDFSRYDTNHDGVITPDELVIVFAHPGGGADPGGLIRGGDGDRAIRDPDTGDYLLLNGVRLIRDAIELATGMPATPEAFVHESCHLMLGLGDMYFWFYTSTAAGPFSVMDQHWTTPHIDPFQKLKLGWAHPRLVLRSGWYTVPDVETRHRTLVLLDPARGTDEYFLVENRWPPGTFDAELPDRGIGVWHVMEDPADHSTAYVPPFTDADTWRQIQREMQWPRTGIRMVHPVVIPPYDFTTALWDGSDAVTGYDLIPADPDPFHPSLRWGDGTPSGFAIRFTRAAADGRVFVKVPWMP